MEWNGTYARNSIGEETHGQFVPLQNDRVRIGNLLLEARSKVLQRGLGDGPRVPKPATVGLDSSRGNVARLVLCGGGDFSFGVSYGVD